MLRRQHKVDDQHHDMALIYYMKGHSLHFGHQEFSLIIGFRFGTVNFDLHPSSDLKFRNRVFPNKIGFIITNLDIIGVIEDEDRFGKLSDDDAIRLCLLLAVEVIFMGRLLTFKVDDTLFRLVENIKAWNSFPWGEHLWCHLYDEIKNLKQWHSDEHYYGLKKDRNYVPTYTLFGFLFAFQIWILKTFERCESWWNKDPKVIPRALGWSKKSLFTRSDYSYLFEKESRSTSDLRPTIVEYQSSCASDPKLLPRHRQAVHSRFTISMLLRGLLEGAIVGFSGATWPASCPSTVTRTTAGATSQRWPTTVNGGQRRSTVADHREPLSDHNQTTGQPPTDHRSTVVDCQSMVGSTVRSGVHVAYHECPRVSHMCPRGLPRVITNNNPEWCCWDSTPRPLGHGFNSTSFTI
ncbi:phospholipase-like protein [Tanacetum coccineum]